MGERTGNPDRGLAEDVRAILEVACTARHTLEPANTLQELVDDLYGAERPRSVVDRLLTERRSEAAHE